MNEKVYKKRLEFQKKVISRKSEENEALKAEIESLKLQLEEKDKIIHSIEPMRKEMIDNVNEQKRLKEQYQKLIQELKQMREILNQSVYRGRWKLIKFLIK